MKLSWKIWLILVIFVFGVFFVLSATTNADSASTTKSEAIFDVSEPIYPNLSLPVRDLPTVTQPPLLNRQIDQLWLGEGLGESSNLLSLDPLVPFSQNSIASPDPYLTFEGLGTDGFTPPDTVGDVGPNHYIQMVNVSFQIWDKGDPANGIPPGIVQPDTLFNTLFAGFGGVCQNSNSGDPIVMYDDMADRWFMSQMGLTGGTSLCIAISTTPDPTGTYYLYEFPMPAFPDYPKYGIWPDAYFATTNSGFPNQYWAHAFDRAAMLAGLPATRQSFGGNPNLMLPADVDGPLAPPVGDPGIFYTFFHPSATGHPPGPERLAFYEFDVDWNTPANSTYTLVEELPIASFNYTLCGFFVECVRQPGTSQLLDDIAWWPMHRMQYRNFGDYEAMVGNFTVDADGANNGGIRWFEVRKTGSTYTLHQEGTHFPDTDTRWMGSIAMDGSGNIALGYSVSSNTTIPSIRYATRRLGDPLGTLNTEASMWVGSGVQTSIERWGDYSAMAVDPVDNCTFWYTTEYHDTNDGGFNWNTRVGIFRVPECTGSLGPDFTMSLTPNALTICSPSTAVSDVNFSWQEGYASPVTLSAVGVPAGYSANFSVNPVVTPTVTSQLTLSNVGAVTPGAYSVNIVGVGTPTPTHTATLQLTLFDALPGAPTLVSPADGATHVDLRPMYQWTAASQVGSYYLEVAEDNGFSNIVYTTTTDGTSHQPNTSLDPLTTYYWRVTASNACGTGAMSSTFSFTTRPIPPILLVDDDDDSPDVQSTWTDALDALGLNYDIWETGSSDIEPTLAEMAPYSAILWFSGDRFGSSGSGPAGPSPATETALASWLSNNNCFFISSQDYRWDKGLTSFMTGYLGVSNVTNDNGDYTSVTGQNVFSGLGPYTLTFPYTDYTDPITPGNGGIQAMLGNNGNVAGVSKDGTTYKTSYWAFGLETLPVAGREASLQTLIDWCDIPVATPSITVNPESLAATQLADQQTTQTLTIGNSGDGDLDWTIFEDGSGASMDGGGDWSEDFDSYGTGQDLHGVGGWKGWDNNPAASASTTDAQALSAPNSVDILGAADLVHEYSGATSGQWTYTTWQYIPTGYTGQSYFIMQNTYNDGGPYSWSVQVCFNSTTGQLHDDVGASCSGTSLPIIFDQWVEIRVEIDLDADSQAFYYNNQLLYQDSWTNHVSTGGVLNIGAVDLFANGATSVYYDDMSLVGPPAADCTTTNDMPWLSLSATSGTTAPGGTSPVDVTFDSTTLAVGEYTGLLCVDSNDPAMPLVQVPVTLTVEVEQYSVLLTTPDDELSGAPGETVTYTVYITNTGNVSDTFDLTVASEWPAELSQTSIPLDAGEMGMFTVEVTVPLTATAWATDGALVTATGGNSQSDSVTLTTTATAVYEVAISADPDALSGAPGAVVTYTVHITNTGNTTDTFTLDTADDQSGWMSHLSVISITLGAGQSDMVMVMVHVAAGAADDEVNVTTVTAVSDMDVSVTAEVELTTTAEIPSTPGFTVYLPIIIKP